MNSTLPRQNNRAELEAYERTCDRLSGFNIKLSTEWIDGFLTALAAGPRVPEAGVWLPAMCDDAFDRAFADPEDQAQALRSLQVRLKVLCDQLDPEALLDAPDELRLSPLMAEWTDADRQELIDEKGMHAEDAALVQTGTEWATGFLDGIQALPELWIEPEDEAAADAFGHSLDQIAALLLAPDSEEFRTHLETYYPSEPDHPAAPPSRDDLLAEACMAVQDLRLYWVDFAPRTVTRRVDSQPGRNDPCPCGSGKKFKKCHGAVA
jgi:uncharacterized protein